MDYPQNLSKSDQHWLDLIQKCRTSGLSDNQWLLENNIKSATFYYHVKKLRQKACEIPQNKLSEVAKIQEVVPLVIKEENSLVVSECNSSMPPAITSAPDLSPVSSASIRLTVQGISVEISNHATQDVIKNTLTALKFLC